MSKLFGREYAYRHVSGRVIEVEHASESSTTGSGCGGEINTSLITGRTHGKIRNISIETTIQRYTRVWITNQGGEAEYIIPQDVPVRNGHEIEITLSLEDKSDTAFVCLLNNKTTRHTTTILNGVQLGKMHKIQKEPWWILVVMAAIVASGCYATYINKNGLYFWLSIVVAFVAGVISATILIYARERIACNFFQKELEKFNASLSD